MKRRLTDEKTGISYDVRVVPPSSVSFQTFAGEFVALCKEVSKTTEVAAEKDQLEFDLGLDKRG